MNICLLTGGWDKPYSLDLLAELASQGLDVDFIGNDEMGESEVVRLAGVRFYNLRGSQAEGASLAEKTVRVLKYYLRLIRYALHSDSEIFHILWHNKFLLFDRSVLTAYYKLLGKKLAFTAHNIDDRQRDGGRNPVHRASLWIFYHLVDHIFVHTRKMKSQLTQEFNVAEEKVSVIPYGINKTLPSTDLTRQAAREKLGYAAQDKVLLFFGHIAPYKGLDYLISALGLLKRNMDGHRMDGHRLGGYRLIIAGHIKNRSCRSYWSKVERAIGQLGLNDIVRKAIGYIPDAEVETYFKASDVLLLPYRFIFQSGVLFLSYSFGLPVIASDVGSLREEIVEGQTGLVCRPEDAESLAEAISRYFTSDLFVNLERYRKQIIDYGNRTHSWGEAGKIMVDAYRKLTGAAL